MYFVSFVFVRISWASRPSECKTRTNYEGPVEETYILKIYSNSYSVVYKYSKCIQYTVHAVIFNVSPLLVLIHGTYLDIPLLNVC